MICSGRISVTSGVFDRVASIYSRGWRSNRMPMPKKTATIVVAVTPKKMRLRTGPTISPGFAFRARGVDIDGESLTTKPGCRGSFRVAKRMSDFSVSASEKPALL
jgi:hypothetical protein